MFVFVVGLILLIFGLAALVLRKRVAGGSFQSTVCLVGVALAAVGVFTVVWDSWTIIPARNVGVVNTFGKADVALDNGAHWVRPWSSVETVDATVQNINLDDRNCLNVRLGNQTRACVELTLQWNISQHANANELWQRYRGTNDDVVGNVGKNVVHRELIRAVGDVFKDYNPLAVLSDPNVKQVSINDLANTARDEMRKSVDPGIVVDTLLISPGGVHYDEVTQQKLNGYAQALADTQIATQQKLTAMQQKLANDQLAVGSSNDPGVKYQNCLNLLKDLAAKGQLENLQQGGLMCSTGDASTPVIVGK